MLGPKRDQWQDFLAGIAVIDSARLGLIVHNLATDLLLSVHLAS
jgi:hypothetical protein